MTGDKAATSRAAELRRAFDQSFAKQSLTDAADIENLLGIQVGRDAYALRLSETAGLFVDRKIISVPSPVAAFLGVAGLRGGIVPVYGLGALLGYPTASEPPRWLVLAGAGNAIALAFEAFDGHFRVFRDAIVPQEAGEHSRKYVHEFTRTQELVRAIVHLPSILDAIKNEISQTGPTEER